MEAERVLTAKLTELTVAIIKLGGIVETNNMLTAQQVSGLREQISAVRDIAEQAKMQAGLSMAGLNIVSPDAKSNAKKSNITIVLLSLISAGVWSLIIFMAMGGA